MPFKVMEKGHLAFGVAEMVNMNVLEVVMLNYVTVLNISKLKK